MTDSRVELKDFLYQAHYPCNTPKCKCQKKLREIELKLGKWVAEVVQDAFKKVRQ